MLLGLDLALRQLSHCESELDVWGHLHEAPANHRCHLLLSHQHMQDDHGNYQPKPYEIYNGAQTMQKKLHLPHRVAHMS